MKTAARLALAAALALVSACKKDAVAPDATPGERAAAVTSGAEAKSGISVSDGKLVLPAVKGRPGAAYFMLSNSDTRPVTLTGVAIAGAGKAEMHETKGGEMDQFARAEVKPGQMVMFERGGKHVMVFDLHQKLAAGGTAQMTLTFSDGDTLTLPLRIEAAGGAGEMDHGAMH